MSSTPKRPQHERYLAGKKGQNTDEFLESRERFSQNPLSPEQFMFLRKAYGGDGPKYILPHIKRIVKKRQDLPRLKRIELRQKYALWSYLSDNWNALFVGKTFCVDEPDEIWKDDILHDTGDDVQLDL